MPPVTFSSPFSRPPLSQALAFCNVSRTTTPANTTHPVTYRPVARIFPGRRLERASATLLRIIEKGDELHDDIRARWFVWA